MRFGSVCSGIEAASVALSPLGWTAEFFAEINPFCCALLKHHYPETVNYGDITTITRTTAIDVLIGGTPCQSFSVTGLRKGLDSPNGQLAIAYCKLAAASRARWIVWENVPGVLQSNRGRDFGSFVGALVEFGYGVAWRVLDSSGFGVPQRRRRLFVVGHLRNQLRSAAVLFDSPARRTDAREVDQVRQERQRVRGASGCYGWTGDETPKHKFECLPTLRACQGGEGVGVLSDAMFRKLTLTEWERAQGFPDGYTNIPGSTPAQRRKAIGNSFCVPVIRWIGQRITEVEKHD